MRHYLSILACSGLLGIGALIGTPAFAGSISSSLSAKPATDGQTWNLSCGAAACQGKFESAVLLYKPADSVGGGLQLVHGHGGGGGGGGHGGFGGGGGARGFGGLSGGGHGFHGMGSFHGMEGFHGFRGEGFRGQRFHEGRFANHRRFFNDNSGGGFENGNLGWGWYGIGIPSWYSYCDPYTYSYYGTCYPGYYPGY